MLLPATLHLSGGFLNPAVTVSLWVFKRIEPGRFWWLIGGQLLGAFAAGLCVRLMFQDSVLGGDAHFGTPHLNLPAFGGVAGGAVSLKMLSSGVAIEFILTFIFTFAIYGTLLDPRAPQVGALGAGLTLTALTLMAFPLTGAAVNPARWLGPALWELTLQRDALRDHLVYWAGPIFGALAAGGVYEYLFWPVAEKNAEPAEATSGGTPVTSTLFKRK
jgi:glycerol uptake facilitator-like aquaporin